VELVGDGPSDMSRERTTRPRGGRPGDGSRLRVSLGGPGTLERSWVESAVSDRGECHCGESTVITLWQEGSRGWEPACTLCAGCECCRFHWDGLIPVEVG